MKQSYRLAVVIALVIAATSLLVGLVGNELNSWPVTNDPDEGTDTWAIKQAHQQHPTWTPEQCEQYIWQPVK